METDGVFNVLNVSEGDKIDFWMLTDDPFDQSRIARRVRQTVFGFPIWVTSPEDAILAKLRWSVMSGSRRTYIDAVGVFEVQGEALDQDYLSTWADRLGVLDLLRTLREEAASG
jgi:hypothetical protein